MPITPGTFAHAKLYDPTLNLRAYADVVLIGPGGKRSGPLQCLVDTGSDYTILPTGLATGVGFTPSGPPVTLIALGGTTYTLTSHNPVSLVVQGYAITGATALFTSAPGFHPILGRPQMINAFDVGFGLTHWYRG